MISATLGVALAPWYGRKVGSGAKEVTVRQKSERLPPELRAPITRQIEQQLEELVAKFGEKQLLEVLNPLGKQQTLYFSAGGDMHSLASSCYEGNFRLVTLWSICKEHRAARGRIRLVDVNI